MIWPMPPLTRRSFARCLLFAPVACLGCGGENLSEDPKVGQKRREKMEAFQKKAELKRKPAAKKSS
jgi:hypothetical protein